MGSLRRPRRVCLRAVSALAVLTWPWQLAVARAGATSAGRYVDDLTARVRGLRAAGPGLASVVWLESALYAEATQLALNLEKPGVFLGCGRSRDQLLALSSPPRAKLLRVFKDFGVQQLAGEAGRRQLKLRLVALTAWAASPCRAPGVS